MLVTTHLFIPGPTNIPEAVRSAMDIRMEDMRSPEFPKFTLPLFEDVKKAFKLSNGRVFLFPSSGTGRLGVGDLQHARTAATRF